MRQCIGPSFGLESELERRRPLQESVAELYSYRLADQPAKDRACHDAPDFAIVLLQSRHSPKAQGLKDLVGGTGLRKILRQLGEHGPCLFVLEEHSQVLVPHAGQVRSGAAPCTAERTSEHDLVEFNWLRRHVVKGIGWRLLSALAWATLLVGQLLVGVFVARGEAARSQEHSGAGHFAETHLLLCFLAAMPAGVLFRFSTSAVASAAGLRCLSQQRQPLAPLESLEPSVEDRLTSLALLLSGGEQHARRKDGQFPGGDRVPNPGAQRQHESLPQASSEPPGRLPNCDC